jgi:hypothetical protein
MLNEYYVADENDYSKGWINYPITNLTPGKHSITVKAWDTYNNPGQGTVNFIVSEKGAFVLEDLGNYPNPFQYETTIYFRHNRPGEDLFAEFSIYDTRGQELEHRSVDIPTSMFEVHVPAGDFAIFSKKLPPGIYFCKVRVRSLADGAESMRVTKLIVAN